MRRSGSTLWHRLAVAAVLMLAAGLVVAVAPTSPAAAQGAVIHVDGAASGANDGSSWADAFTDLQDALAAAVAGDEIRVAEGTYTPHASDRTVSFGLVDGVAMTGGYATSGLAGPDSHLYETVLSGDLAGDDLPGFVNNGENSEHVVTSDGVSGATVLDGFTVVGGNADIAGGGIFVSTGGSLTVRNAVIMGNSANSGGGLRAVSGTTLSIIDSVVSGNEARQYGGGGVSIGSSGQVGSLTVVGSTIVDNTANGFGGDGAGVAAGNVDISVVDSTVAGNTAGGNGGGIHLSSVFSVPGGPELGRGLTNTLVADNAAGGEGGGIEVTGLVGWIPSNLGLTNSTVADNTAGVDGGGLGGGSYAVTNSIVWGNSPTGGFTALADGTLYQGVNHSDVEDWTGGGVGNIDADPLFTGAGDYRLREGSPAIHAGDDPAVPVDTFDVDGDGDTAEPTPDLDLSERIQGPAVDMGAYETRVLQPGGFGTAEGDSGSQVFEIPISLSAPSTETITVDYVSWPCQVFDGCGDGLATEGVDYESPAPGTLTFAPGETTKTVPVTVYGDTEVEPRLWLGEWFLIRFLNPSPNAVLDTSFFGLGAGVIGNDDP